MKIVVEQKGSLKRTERFLKRASNINYKSILQKYAQEGVAALAAATPVESGTTANSWDYEIRVSQGRYSIAWTNSNIVDGVQIAVIIQYGHATRNGGWVQGRDYINPALQPIFDKIANELWREVTKP